MRRGDGIEATLTGAWREGRVPAQETALVLRTERWFLLTRNLRQKVPPILVQLLNARALVRQSPRSALYMGEEEKSKNEHLDRLRSSIAVHSAHSDVKKQSKITSTLQFSFASRGCFYIFRIAGRERNRL